MIEREGDGKAMKPPLPARSSGTPRAVLAALFCGLAVLAVGVVHGQSGATRPVAPGALAPGAAAGSVGSQTCAGCHAAQTRAWAGSQHARAMQEATDATVLGDFNGATAEHFGSRARFLRKDGQFIVETEGKDGKPAAFTVRYTFGLEPLQQYLVAFPDGRIQALPFAWDTRPRAEGGQRWFHLYQGEAIPHTDPLHWTGPQQNWNYMCADCHSTSVRKGYDPAANRFTTTFSETSVGCESCHGAGAGHLAWATGPRSTEVPNKGFAHAAARRPAPDWTPDPVTGSPAHGVSRPVGDEVETCGTCHARRGQFAEGWQPGQSLLDAYRLAFLTAGLFEVDGQMRDEVFNYASFQQSKMHAKGVVCSDCHEPHGGKLRAAGSEVCSQCHLPQKFAAAAHTGHPAGTGSPDCIACHMPARTYMVVDPRHDHSFRIPRPDLSVKLGSPNACNDCHRDRSAAWAASAVEQWHGSERKGFQTYAGAFHAARTGQPDARELLLKVARDAATPALVRATAILELQGWPSAEVEDVTARGLSDADPMVRIAALRGLAALPPDQGWRRGNALLSDPVRAVRIEAASALAGALTAGAPVAEREAFARAAAEYVAAERFNADRAENRSNLAAFFARQGRGPEAEQEFLAAMTLAPAFVPPRVGLADLFRSQGREAEAESLLRQTISIAPTAAAPRHALGLALIRLKRYGDALDYLKRATELEPDNARYAYVYAIALQSAGRAAESRQVLEKALASNPSSVDVLSALFQDAMRTRDAARTLSYAERLRVLVPDDPALARLVDQMRQGARP